MVMGVGGGFKPLAPVNTARYLQVRVLVVGDTRSDAVGLPRELHGRPARPAAGKVVDSSRRDAVAHARMGITAAF